MIKLAEKNTPKILGEETVYKRGIEVVMAKVDFGDGTVHDQEYRKLPDVVAIVPIDSENNVYLCKEWRTAHRKYVLQIPAGKCNEKTEDGRIRQAHNELREEVGLDARKLEKLYSGLFMASIQSNVSIYLARELFESKKNPDSDEKIEVVKIPFEEALNLFSTGKEETLSYSYLGLVLARDKLGLQNKIF